VIQDLKTVELKGVFKQMAMFETLKTGDILLAEDSAIFYVI